MTVAQRSIFDQPLYRGSDPDTAVAAGKRAKSHAETDREYALRIHRQHPSGLTDFELGDLMGRQQTSAGKRRLELQRQGQIVDSGRRRAAPSGSLAIVWRAT